MDRQEQAQQAKRQYMREYMREWRKSKANKEKIKQYNHTYWARRAIEVRSLDLDSLERELEQLKHRA